jgi:phosphatidylinositol alpha-1,6-mannosyltransferase
MRILMLNNEFPPLGGGTGTANRAMLQYFGQVQGLEIDLITSALGKRAEKEVFAERITIHKVPVNNNNIHHSSNRELSTYAARGFFHALKLHRKRNYDLCFAWSAVPAGAVALLLQKLAGLPYLVRVCGPDIPGFEPRYQIISSVLSPLIRMTFHNAVAVVAKSEGEREMIRALTRNADVTIVPNGVDLNVFQPGDSIPDDGPLRLLCVARLIARKGQNHLIEAVKRLTDLGIDVTLDLIGEGDARHAYESQTKKLGLRPKIKFQGYVPREQIAEHYDRAHVFMLPSYNEGMSVATLEAMAAGLPLVTTRTCGTQELVEEGVNGWTHDWGDIETLTAHIKRLATDRTLARRMSVFSRSRAEQFSWEIGATLYLELFKQIITHRLSPRLQTEKALT